MILKTKYGKEINTDDFKFYGFGDYMRKNHDKEWGSNLPEKTKMFEVELVCQISGTGVAFVNVTAKDEKEAEEIAKEEVSRIDWEVDIDDYDCVRAVNVEEKSDD